MVARAVDHAEARLRGLRRAQREGFAVSSFAFALAIGAAGLHLSLALPLLAGGLFVAARATRATWQRWELVDNLAAEHDAYRIPEVWKRASRLAGPTSRREFAACIKELLGAARLARIAPLRAELEVLATGLLDETLDFDPQAAVVCDRLLRGPDSPLYADGYSSGDVRSRVRRIQAGLVPHDRG